nr:protein kinase [Gemmatimonadaceae bacterium]
MAKSCPVCGVSYDETSAFCPADGATLQVVDTGSGLVGAVLADRYRITGALGEGGMGRVYRARHVRLPQEVAIKVLRPELARDAAMVARFVREASNAARIVHPNVVRVLDSGELPGGTVYIAMEYVHGVTLGLLLRAEGALAPARAASIVVQVAHALAAAHAMGIIHRDLKPDNVMVARDVAGDERALVLDFGIAKALHAEGEEKLTRTGFIVGTPEYMSPEQVMAAPLGTPSDVFALALIAVKCLTGTLPYDPDATDRGLLERVTGAPRPLAVLRPDVAWPASLQAVLDAALMRDPQQRTPDVLSFAHALRDAVAAWDGASGVAAAPAATTAPAASTPAASTPASPLASAPAPDAPTSPPMRTPVTPVAMEELHTADVTVPARAMPPLDGVTLIGREPTPAQAAERTIGAAGGAAGGASRAATPAARATIADAAPRGGGARWIAGGVAVAVAALATWWLLPTRAPGTSATIRADSIAVRAPDDGRATPMAGDGVANRAASPDSMVVRAPGSEAASITPPAMRDADSSRADGPPPRTASPSGAAPPARDAAGVATRDDADEATRDPRDRRADRYALRLTPVEARRTLDSLTRALDPAHADEATARTAVARLGTILPYLGSATDSTWGYVRLLEADLLLDDQRGACRALASARRLATSRAQRE